MFVKPTYLYTRGYSRNYYNHKNQLVKQIIYPRKLWLTKVYSDDPIELKIKEIELNWNKIEITMDNNSVPIFKIN